MTGGKAWPEGLGQYKVGLVNELADADRRLAAAARDDNARQAAYARGARDAYLYALGRLDGAMRHDGYSVA